MSASPPIMLDSRSLIYKALPPNCAAAELRHHAHRQSSQERQRNHEEHRACHPYLLTCYIRFGTQLSSSMAFLHLLTTIQAFFSTTFFNFNPGGDSRQEGWVMSKEIWIYFTITLPLTAIGISFWYFWHRFQKNDDER